MKTKIFKALKKTIIVVLILITCFIIYFGGVILYSYITDYKPNLVEKIDIINSKTSIKIYSNRTEFSILTWNIGYCGLGKEQDFFYDGGKMVRPNENDYKKYQKGIIRFISKMNFIDFILLQEVDLSAKRSYKENQVDILSSSLPNMSYTFTKNYNVDFVPIPIFEPMGKVKAGLMNLSLFEPSEAQRFSFPVNFSWWKRIFMLDRCFSLQRFALSSGKDLVIINIHNSAFDDENILKPIELNTIKTKLIEEFTKGNYVIAGGDWNQNPPNFDVLKIDKLWNPVTIDTPINSNLMPDNWLWIYPESIPTERFNDKPFVKGVNKTTTIDYFLVSPNVKSISVKTIDLGFSYSDHQPVIMDFEILK